MDTVLDEVTSDALTAGHVERRVRDWAKRLDGLYTAIGEWLPSDWEARRGTPELMHEKMMRAFGVAARRIPTLELRGRLGDLVRFRPHALWIIGNNGRIDVKRGDQRYIIIDAAENFREPDWQVAPAEHRHEREPVTPDWLRRILQ